MWLDFCGLSREESFGRQPKDLIQGALTSKEHIKIMHDYLAASRQNLDSNTPLVIPDLVNYRKIETPAGIKRVPFQFKLTMQTLHSVETGKPFPIFQMFLGQLHHSFIRSCF